MWRHAIEGDALSLQLIQHKSCLNQTVVYIRTPEEQPHQSTISGQLATIVAVTNPKLSFLQLFVYHLHREGVATPTTMNF